MRNITYCIALLSLSSLMAKPLALTQKSGSEILPKYVITEHLPPMFKSILEQRYLPYVRTGEEEYFKNSYIHSTFYSIFKEKNLFDPFEKAKKAHIRDSYQTLIDHNELNFRCRGLKEENVAKVDSVKVSFAFIYKAPDMKLKSINFNLGLNYPTEIKANFEYISDDIYIMFRLRHLDLKKGIISCDIITIMEIEDEKETHTIASSRQVISEELLKDYNIVSRETGFHEKLSSSLYLIKVEKLTKKKYKLPEYLRKMLKK